MKKTLAAIAVIGAFSGSALATEVQIYGIVDTGVVYQHADDYDLNGGAITNVESDSLSMGSGIIAGSRFGFKGTEDLGNGLTVGFVLENGFSSDTGDMTQGGRMFGRESQIFLRSNLGELSFGRVGNLNSGNGTYGLTGAISPFGTTWGDYSAAPNNVMSGFDRYDNTITYKSPTFAGFNVYLQYSMDTDTQAKNDGTNHGEENKSSVDRYYALGVTYANGPLNLVAVVDQTNYSSWARDAAPEWGTEDLDDSIAVTIGGSYDFDVVKLYAGAQYFDNTDINSIDRLSSEDYAITSGDRFAATGFAFTLGADVPLGSGVLKVGTSYLDSTFEQVNGWDMDSTDIGEVDFKRWNTSVGYQYNLSKRTSLYGVVSYSYNETDCKVAAFSVEPTWIEAAIGLMHKF